MKQLRNDLQAVKKSLKQMAKITERMAKKLDKLDKVKPAKPRKKAVARKKAAKPKGIDLVYGIIKRSRRGVDTATLKKKTGFDDKKVYNTINMLKRKGLVKSADRGRYVKA